MINSFKRKRTEFIAKLIMLGFSPSGVRHGVLFLHINPDISIEVNSLSEYMYIEMPHTGLMIRDDYDDALQILVQALE